MPRKESKAFLHDPSDKKQPELSIILLCYKSEETIESFALQVKELAEKLTDRYEIFLVANYIEGETDRTAEIVEHIVRSDSTFKAVCNPKKGMMGWDMKEGLQRAEGDVLCVIDGDGQFPAENITQCYEIIKTGAYGLVKTYRTKRNDGMYRKIISAVYNRIFSILFPGVNSKDVNSKPKIFTREVYNQMTLTSDDWFIDAEIMIHLDRLGIKFYEIPTEFHGLNGRVSCINAAAIIEFIRNLFIFRFKGNKS